MDIKELIESIRNMPGCKVRPARGLPEIPGGLILPEDVKEFYSLCDGMSLFMNTEYPIKIVPAYKMRLADPVIRGFLKEDDITSSWFIIAHDCDGDYITIDLSEHREGRIYDSYWDKHGVEGECPVIALNFKEFLEGVVKNCGEEYYWIQHDYKAHGDAYFMDENIKIEA